MLEKFIKFKNNDFHLLKKSKRANKIKFHKKNNFQVVQQ